MISGQSESIDKLAAALSKAQGEILGAKKTTENTFFHKKYADLEEVIIAVKKPLLENGLAVLQLFEEDFIITKVVHSSGQWIQGGLKMVYEKQTPQGVGISISYYRRYCLSAMLGVYQEDDDGNSVSGNKGPDPKNDIDAQYEKAKEWFNERAGDIILESDQRNIKTAWKKKYDLVKLHAKLQHEIPPRSGSVSKPNIGE